MIEVGLGLENVINDEMAAKIIRDDMAPRFREKDYYGGITNAVKKIKKVIEDNKEFIGK